MTCRIYPREKASKKRTSEKSQKITDIYALSADYDKEAPIMRNFFASVQNKLHWAIIVKTAAETIYESGDRGACAVACTGHRLPSGSLSYKMKGLNL